MLGNYTLFPGTRLNYFNYLVLQPESVAGDFFYKIFGNAKNNFLYQHAHTIHQYIFSFMKIY